jgi:dihydrofolate reductase
MKISIIVAADLKNCIGKDNQLPWHLNNDLKNFKKITTNHCIIMGRNTFDSIGKPLPNRVNIVLSKNEYFKQDGIVVRASIEEALAYCAKWKQEHVFIIGGDSIYRQTMEKADKIYLTRVETEVENGDAFFPELDEKIWRISKAERFEKDEKNDFDHSFEEYLKSDEEQIIYR